MKKSTLIVFIAIFLFGSFSPASALTDPAGSLVHHLFNISKAPEVKALAFRPGSQELWAILLLNPKRAISVYNSTTGEKISDINLDGGGGVEIVFTKDGTKAYISQMETAKVFEVDANTKKILRTFKTGGNWTKVVALSPDEQTLYASNWISNNVSVIDLKTGTLTKKIKTVVTPRGLYPTQDGKKLYVAGFDKGQLQKIDLLNGTSKTIYKDGLALRHIVADEAKGVLYISDMGRAQILKVSLINDTVSVFAKTDNDPNTIALSPDKKVLYVSNRGKNASADNYYVPGPEWGTVLLFDTATGKMLDAIIGGNQPTALAVSQDGTTLAFSDFLDSKLELFQLPSYKTLLAGNGGRSTLYKKEIKKTHWVFGQW